MIDPLVKQRLLERLQRLKAEGRLLSRAQLDGYYAAFRERFGPEVLADLDGEALLETMHNREDSLVYWLEYKSDEDFPTTAFGSIAGGSAAKFGIFRRKETDMWEVGEGRGTREISVDEAIAVAQKHRDQLVHGADILRSMAPGSTDDDYRAVQTALDKEARDVSDKAWGRKYFSLLFPDVLDDYHNPNLQRFHLRKLLQEPPDDGDGRYVCAGRFVALAAELEVPLNHLTVALNSLSHWHKYWLVKAEPSERWAMMRDGGLTVIGWPKLGDLSWLPRKITKEVNARFRRLIDEHYPDRKSATRRVLDFVSEMGEGDLVVAVDGGFVVGVGRVAGDYAFEAESEFPHQRPVEWLSFDRWTLPAAERKAVPIREIKAGANILEIERRTQASPGPAVPPPQPPSDIPKPRRPPPVGWRSGAYPGGSRPQEPVHPARASWDGEDILGGADGA